MKKNLKTLIIIFSLFVSGMFLSANFSVKGITTPTVFWLEVDDGYAMNVTTLNSGGSTTLDIGDGSFIQEGQSFFLVIESLPTDWLADPNEVMEVSEYVSGSLGPGIEVDISNFKAPWIYNATTLYDESAGQGPPLLIPSLPLPLDPANNAGYYSTLTSEFSSRGFTVVEDGEYISISATDVAGEGATTFSVKTSVSKGIGLMHNYTYTTSTGDELSMEFDSVLSTSNFPLSWSSEDPVLSYEILTANGTDGFSFEVENPGDSPYEPKRGEGTVFKDQLLQFDLSNFTDFVDGPSGYEMEMHTETGHVGFDIYIELPNYDVRNNTYYLYPLFPVADRTLIKAYFAMSLVAGFNYSYSIENDIDWATINFDNGNDSVTATWDLTNGVLQYWKLNQLHPDSGIRSILEFQLISATTLTDLAPYWGQTTGVAHTYTLESLNTTTGHQLDLSRDANGHGYIAEGESIYFELINNSVFGDSTPLQLTQDGSDDGNDGPISYYNLGGPNGGSTVNIRFAFPGDTKWDGPPMFYPYLLLGTTAYFEWVKSQYGWAGLVFDYDSTKVWFDWTLDTGDFTGTVHAEWDKTTGVLQEYLVSINEDFTDPEVFEMHLVLEGTGIPNYTTQIPTTPTTSTTPPSSSSSDTSDGAGLPFSNPFIFIFILIALPLLRKYSKK